MLIRYTLYNTLQSSISKLACRVSTLFESSYLGLFIAGLAPPQANGIPGARPAGPRVPSFGVRPGGPPSLGVSPPQSPAAPQTPGGSFPPQQQTLGRPGLVPPGNICPLLQILHKSCLHREALQQEPAARQQIQAVVPEEQYAQALIESDPCWAIQSHTGKYASSGSTC